VEQRPVLGIGVGAFPVAEGTLSVIGRELASRGSGFKWSVAHNSFVETAAELGIPGIVLFVSLLVVTIATMARIRSGRRYGPLISKRETALGQMMVGSLLGYCVGGFFVSAEYYSYLYFLVGLAVGLDKVLRLRRRATMTAIAAYVPQVRLSSVPAGSLAAVKPPRP
jgi:O-antigen ligase